MSASGEKLRMQPDDDAHDQLADRQRGRPHTQAHEGVLKQLQEQLGATARG